MMKRIFILISFMVFSSFIPVFAANTGSDTVTLPPQSSFSVNAQNLINEKAKSQDSEEINTKNKKNYEDQEDFGNAFKMINGFTGMFNPMMMQQQYPHY